MNTLSLNSNFSSQPSMETDVLSEYNRADKKNLTIRQGMSVNEISDVVSERVINGIKQQFEKTKQQYEKAQNKK